MNIEEIKKIVALMDENNLVEVEIEENGRKIHLKKAGAVQNFTSLPHVVSITPSSNHTPITSAPVSQGKTREEELHLVKSPLVGTFYRAPKPESPPFVEEGQSVSKGQTLCIVEAMKVMNEIKSDVNGIIKEICVKNAQPVDFGKILFKIKPE